MKLKALGSVLSLSILLFLYPLKRRQSLLWSAFKKKLPIKLCLITWYLAGDTVMGAFRRWALGLGSSVMTWHWTWIDQQYSMNNHMLTWYTMLSVFPNVGAKMSHYIAPG